MGLREAILDVAEEMEKLAQSCEDSGKSVKIGNVHMWAALLRVACKASEGVQQGIQAYPNGTIPAEIQHRQAIEAAKVEFRKSKLQEEGEIIPVLCADGPLEGDGVPCDPGMPVGARTNLDGHVYRLGEDRRLHYEEPKAEPPKIVTA